MCSRGSQRESFEQMNEVIAHRTGRTHPTRRGSIRFSGGRQLVAVCCPKKFGSFAGKHATPSRTAVVSIVIAVCYTPFVVFTKENRGGGGEDSVLQRANSVLYPARLPQHTSQPSRSRCV